MFGEIENTNPFPGLRSFEESEDLFFFGREQQTDELIKTLRLTRFLAVIGSSGSGKSSLVKSGLIPSLHSGLMSGTNSAWRIAIMRPGINPIHNLAKALTSNSILSSESDDIDHGTQLMINESILRRSSNGLYEAFNQSTVSKEPNLLIIVDQFEELFRFNKLEKESKDGKRDSSAFINLLIKASEQLDLPIYVVLTMRSDFLGNCTEFRGLPEAINKGHYLIPRMTRSERKETVVGPIAVAGASITSSLVDQILNDVGENQDQLPIMQHALMRTWDNWKSKGDLDSPIDSSNYNAIGTMKHALSKHAEEAYAELNSENQRRICETLFKTLTDKGSEGKGVRRPSKLSELSLAANATNDEVIEIIDVFRKVGRAFLMPPIESTLNSDSVIDISHESLMRVWDRLKKWVTDEKDSAEVYESLANSAKLYELGKTGLWKDPDLSIALKWKEKHQPNATWASRYNDNYEKTMSFLQYSQDQFEFEIAQKELQEKKRLKRSRQIAMVLAAASIICLVFTFISFGLASKAEASKKEAIISANEANEERIRAEQNEQVANEEKIRAEKQKLIAEKQKLIAEKQTELAENQKRNAERQKSLAEEQRNLAKESEKRAEQEKVKAEVARLKAEEEREKAKMNELEAKMKTIEADSMRNLAIVSEKETNRLRLLTLSSSLGNQAIRQYNTNQELAHLLASQAYFFNKENGGAEFVPEIFSALSKVTGTQKTFTPLNTGIRSISANYKNTIAIGDEEGNINLWRDLDLNSKPEVYRSNLSKYPNIRTLSFSNDGKILAAGDASGMLLLFNDGSLQSVPTILNPHTGPITEMLFTQDDRFLFTSSGDSTILRVDLQSPPPFNSKVIKEVDSRIMSIALLPNDSGLVAACENGKLIKLNNILGESISSDQILKTHPGELIKSLQFSNKGEYLACGLNNGTFYLFDERKNFENPERVKGHKSPIFSMDFLVGKNILATSSGSGEIKIWDIKNLLAKPIILNEHDSWIWDLAFIEKSNLLFSVGADKKVSLWDFDLDKMESINCSQITRKLTQEEWNTFIGSDIPLSDPCIQLDLNN